MALGGDSIPQPSELVSKLFFSGVNFRFFFHLLQPLLSNYLKLSYLQVIFKNVKNIWTVLLNVLQSSQRNFELSL